MVCLLEGSGKWPEDVEAVRRMKAAFYIQLSQALENTAGSLVQAYTDHVDVCKVSPMTSDVFVMEALEGC